MTENTNVEAERLLADFLAKWQDETVRSHRAGWSTTGLVGEAGNQMTSLTLYYQSALDSPRRELEIVPQSIDGKLCLGVRTHDGHVMYLSSTEAKDAHDAGS